MKTNCPSPVVTAPGSPLSSELRACRRRADALHAAVVLASIAAASIALVACGEASHAQGAGAHQGPPPAAVSVAAVATTALPMSYEYVGQTAGSRDVEVRARVSGILLKRNFTEGGTVRKGQSLYTIDPVPFQVALAKADADVASAEAKLSGHARSIVWKPL
ncbi:MAG: biotin/lipoyl-binding protein [Ideonella sp.]|nr:biotin/lipoyl-binding protein [Ideonella sp.]